MECLLLSGHGLGDDSIHQHLAAILVPRLRLGTRKTRLRLEMAVEPESPIEVPSRSLGTRDHEKSLPGTHPQPLPRGEPDVDGDLGYAPVPLLGGG